VTRTSLTLGALFVLAAGGLAILAGIWSPGLGEVQGATPAQTEAAARPGGHAFPTVTASPLELDLELEEASLSPQAPPAAESLSGDARRSEGQRSDQPLRGSLPARLHGAIQGPNGPVLGAQVQLLSNAQADSFGLQLHSVNSNVDGGFSLTTGAEVDLGTDSLVVEVSSRGYAPHRIRIRRLIPGESRNLGTIRLSAARVLDIDVTDVGGRPLSGASVQVELASNSGGNSFRHQGESSQDGRVRLSDAPLGLLRVEVRAPNNGTRVLNHEHNGSGRPLRIAMVAERQLALRVRAADGTPIAAAEVTLTATDGRRETYTEVSASDGAALFEGLGSDLFEARVVATGYRTDTRRGLVSNGPEVLVELLPWPAIEGRVLTTSGEPAPSGTVARGLMNISRTTLLRTRGPGQDDPVAIDTDGKLRVPDLRPGEYVVRVDAPGYAPAFSEPVRVALNETPSVGTLFLQKGSALELRIQAGRDSTPVPGARVELHAEAPATASLYNELPAYAAAILASATSDESGRVRFENLSAGQYYALVRSAAYQAHQTSPFQVTQGHTAKPAPLKLTPGVVLRGTLRHAGGSPAVNAVVVLRGARIETPVQLTTDALGAFESPPLPPGSWDVTARTVSASRGAKAIERTVVLSATRDADPLEIILTD
jgi:hypothetical protein